jgi:nucleoid-associated protein YgaU
LSKIGSHYGVSWQKIFEANRDKLDDADKIRPGQELKIPQG